MSVSGFDRAAKRVEQWIRRWEEAPLYWLRSDEYRQVWDALAHAQREIASPADRGAYNDLADRIETLDSAQRLKEGLLLGGFFVAFVAAWALRPPA
jgi:hypothetical protein